MSVNTFDHFVTFTDPFFETDTVWNGSLSFHSVEGCRVRVSCNYTDPRMDMRNALPVQAIDQLNLTADCHQSVVLLAMNGAGSNFSLKGQKVLITETFLANILVTSDDLGLKNLNKAVRQFHVHSPIVFSFIDHHAYDAHATKKGRKFSVTDIPLKTIRFESQIFKSIEFNINRSMSNSSSGNVGTIKYSGMASFVCQKPIPLRHVVGMSQVFEKLLFLLVGDHCGPMRVVVPRTKRTPPLCETFYASPFYANDDVVEGIWRCWTLKKVSFEFGKLLDLLVANYQKFEVALELLLDARMQDEVQARFFRLVRSFEAISRELMPRGSEEVPKEFLALRELVKAQNNDELSRFFEKRVTPVFKKRNTIGYGIELAKNTFPFGPVLELDKASIGRLRNLEAHAAAHNFTAEEKNDMHRFVDVLDFLCRACILLTLGMTQEQIASGVPGGRFSFLLGKR